MKLSTPYWIAGAALAAIAAPLAAAPAPKDAAVVAQITQELKKRYPEVQISGVEKSPIPGLYTVYAGEQVIYSSPSADYVITGTLIETSSGKNMTHELMDIHRSIDFSTLPFDKAIKIVKGSGERVVAIFSDPDCPFCQTLEKELGSVADTTVYIFLYPIASLHPEAEARSRAIWCSAQREQAWSRWMLEKSLPEQATCDGDPIKDLQALAAKLNISSTPTLFFANGRRFSGAPAAGALVTLFKEHSKPAAKTAKNLP